MQSFYISSLTSHTWLHYNHPGRLKKYCCLKEDRDHILYDAVNKITRISKCIETENTLVITRGWEIGLVGERE